jgi:hypothetical protein
LTRFIWTGRHGHEFLLDPDEGRDSFGDTVAHHRLLAYAWGLLDHPYEKLEVDHIVEIPWFNAELNLDPKPIDEHSRKTRQSMIQRKQLAADGGRS